MASLFKALLVNHPQPIAPWPGVMVELRVVCEAYSMDPPSSIPFSGTLSINYIGWVIFNRSPQPVLGAQGLTLE